MSGEAVEVPSRQWLGIVCMILSTIIFAAQDAVSKILVETYPVTFLALLRYWFFLIIGLYMVSKAKGGVRYNIKTSRIVIHCLRGAVLLAEMITITLAFRFMGIADVIALFQVSPLFGAILAVIFLREVVGWRRIMALIIGFIGVLVMLRPGMGVFSSGSFYALFAAFLFALYGILTRFVSDRDSSTTSFFYIALVGSVIMTIALPFVWVPISGQDSHWLVIICFTALAGHILTIKAFSFAPATIIQPFGYMQLVWSVIIGYLVFSDFPDEFTLIGAAIVVASGLYIFYREQIRKKQGN